MFVDGIKLHQVASCTNDARLLQSHLSNFIKRYKNNFVTLNINKYQVLTLLISFE